MVATYGEGEPCDNSRKLHQWLLDNTSTSHPPLLNGKPFAVFGLGNRQCVHPTPTIKTDFLCDE